MKTEPTAERLLEYLRYDPETGNLIWRKTKGSKAPAGSIAGTIDKHGYRCMAFDQHLYKVHRVIWFLVTGSWPDGVIDHINGDPGDNRMSNLRVVPQAINMQNRRKCRANSKSGVMGVYFSAGKFNAQITLNGVLHYLGRYATAEEAHTVYVKAKRTMHPGNTL